MQRLGTGACAVEPQEPNGAQLVLHGVLAGGLAEGLGTGRRVEDVVDDLEAESQRNAEGLESLDRGVVGAHGLGTARGSGGDQGGRLLRVDQGERLGIGRVLLRSEVAHLARHHALRPRRAREAQAQCARTCRFGRRGEQVLEREGVQGIAGEDRGRFVIGDVTRRSSASQGVVIHGREVVVNEAVRVHTLEGNGEGARRVGGLRNALRRRVGQERADALAATQGHVAHGLEQARLGAGGGHQRRVEIRLEAVAHLGHPGIEFRCGHGVTIKGAACRANDLPVDPRVFHGQARRRIGVVARSLGRLGAMASSLPFRSLDDLRALDRDKLIDVCEAVRAVLHDGVPEDARAYLPREETAVELAVALHRAFDFRRDRLVADASHPVLAHKVLTGRAHRLGTLGQADGMAFGMRRAESPYDAVTSALAGTGVSVGAGMATADRVRGWSDRRIVVLLGGEGAEMGQTLEALDRVGGTDTRVLVILNDDRETQPRSAGAVRRYVHRMRTLPAYREGKKELVDAISMVPFVGDALSRFAGNVKEAVANYLSPGHLFRELGWTYFGPEDGHDVLRLEQLLLDLHRVEGPVLLHLVTRRPDELVGRDAAPISEGATHPPVASVDGPKHAASSPAKSWQAAIDRALRGRMLHDPRIHCVSVAGAGGLPEGLPSDRGIDAGPSPMHAVALAAGMAEMGLKPVVRIPASLGSRALDALRQEIVLPDLPVVVVLEGIGLGEGDAPHVLDDLGLWRPLAGLALPMPTDGRDVAVHLKHALGMPSPSLLRVPSGPLPAPTGSADIPLRPGRLAALRPAGDVILVGTGSTVRAALDAADLLAEEGVAVGVFDARFAAPLPVEALLRATREAHHVVVVEEHVATGGFFEGLRGVWPTTEGPTLLRWGVPERVATPGGGDAWRQRYRLDAHGLALQVRRLLAASPEAVAESTT